MILKLMPLYVRKQGGFGPDAEVLSRGFPPQLYMAVIGRTTSRQWS
ncbi:hypothetical protein I550_0285 [Mycobacterium intracellulare 1956]|uniref:Uncharacterized protein n=1 Tax=Mycobacterium intracellulare 1956 TaxID=1299331 RepID=X8CPG8_MYCIT|nr:hypothetical protein I548_3265 [Mycobacterium intracellulare]EUA57165.1 hypothetical protein I550_0285 [Mycobacterium intracellulare 1956]